MNDRNKDQLGKPSTPDVTVPPDKNVGVRQPAVKGDAVAPPPTGVPPAPQPRTVRPGSAGSDQVPPPPMRGAADSSIKPPAPSQPAPTARQRVQRPDSPKVPTSPPSVTAPPPTAVDPVDSRPKRRMRQQPVPEVPTPPLVDRQPVSASGPIFGESTRAKPQSSPAPKAIDPPDFERGEPATASSTPSSPQPGSQNEEESSPQKKQPALIVDETAAQSIEPAADIQKKQKIVVGDYFIWNPTNANIVVRTHTSVLRQVLDESLAGIQGAETFEIGGMFFGSHCVNEATEQYEITIDIAVPVEFDDATATEFTFTGPAIKKTKEKLRLTNEKHGRDYAIVGYYHSHPDHDIFLSTNDQNTFHRNFTGPHSLAMVIQPRRKTAGFFPLEEYENHPNYRRSKRVFHLVDPSRAIGYTHGKPAEGAAGKHRYVAPKNQEAAPTFSVGPRPGFSEEAFIKDEVPKQWWFEFVTNWRTMAPATIIVVMALLALLLIFTGGDNALPPEFDLRVEPIKANENVTVRWSNLPFEKIKDDFVSASIFFYRPLQGQEPIDEINITNFDRLKKGKITRKVTAALFSSGRGDIEITMEVQLKKHKLTGQDTKRSFDKTRRKKDFRLKLEDSAVTWSLDTFSSDEKAKIAAGTVVVKFKNSVRLCREVRTKEQLLEGARRPLLLSSLCPRAQDEKSIRYIAIEIDIEGEEEFYFYDRYTPPPPKIAKPPFPGAGPVGIIKDNF